MKLLVLQDELAELEARLERGVESVVIHELLPFFRVEDLLEDVDPEGLLLRREPRRRHDRSHDEVVVDRYPLRLARRETRVDPGLRALGSERAERPKLLRAGLIEGESPAGVVHRGDGAALATRECC